MRLTAMILAVCLLLTGCANPFADYREIEHLLVIQTMGIDEAGGAVKLSLAASANGDEKAPRCLSACGSTIVSALEHIYDYSYEEDVFCYNVKNVLLGESAAEKGCLEYLAFICRSPVTRIDVPLFIVKDGGADELFTGTGDEKRAISDIMQNVQQKLDRRGGSTFSSADVMRGVLRGGSALVCALSLEKSAEDEADGSAPGMTAVPAGYAVIREGKLCKYIDADNAVVTDMLLSRGGLHEIEVSDGRGGRIALEAANGRADFTPVWDGDTLKEMRVHISAQYSVLETNGRADLRDAQYVDALTAALETELLSRAGEVLKLSADLKADFLNLGAYAERSRPEAFRKMKQSFAELLLGLEFQVTVSCRLSHTNDMEEL